MKVKRIQNKMIKTRQKSLNAWESTHTFYHIEFLLNNENGPIQKSTLLPYI